MIASAYNNIYFTINVCVPNHIYGGIIMNETLKGRWSYRSFRHDPIAVKDGHVEGNPKLAIPWSPPGVLDVDTNEAGEITGKLKFSEEVVLDIKGRVIPATDKEPTSVELVGQFQSSVNRLKGFFIPGSNHIVGTILSIADDLAKQPVGTAGPFVLFPI
jgi:hypothetical protein